MERPLPDVLNVVACTELSPQAVERIKAVAPSRINLTVDLIDFLPELRDEWPERSLQRLMQAPPSGRTQAEVDHLVRSMHVALLSFVYPKALPKRAHNLLWAHYGLAGVSGLRGSDWWDAPFPVTSGRGSTSTVSTAESAMGGVFLFARRLNVAVLGTVNGNFDPAAYQGMSLIAGKTMGIVGLGGVGRHTARLARGCGMRVVATRRSATVRQESVEDVDVLYPAAELHAMLAETDYLVVAAMLTEETRGMIGMAEFAALKPGAYLINVARGQILEEAPFVAALRSGSVAGAYIDVWDDDWAGPPSAGLRSAPNLVISPRIGNRSDVPPVSVEFFCENLARLLNGEPLVNVIDWERGY